ncbi:hypothetical protein B0H16DRAFT_1861677 [Mycena metata]|uniref:Novel STAND NTPase 1 domain-containing protein n=1 Tax=Mycena metata TaxID=1033252 RepID=A0AAD7IHS3_9AGAR|nr:hypothetical protein B0H16DRAFT_1861677 [Mycena metata]
MPRQPTVTKVRLDNISTCVAITASTFNLLVDTLKISGLEAISNTTQSLLKLLKTRSRLDIQTVKQEKNECVDLMEHTHKLLVAIIDAYVKSDTGVELPPSTLNEIANFTHHEAEAKCLALSTKFIHLLRHNKVAAESKSFFGRENWVHYSRIARWDCNRDFYFFREMEGQAKIRHQEVLNMIETISSSDSASFISQMYSSSYASSNSFSMLPAQPQIFHGRESELADILKHFKQGTPRIAILGAGGMGKTSLAQCVLHHEEIVIKYQGNRLFVACDMAVSKVELAGLIGAHLGMKPGQDLTQAVLHRLAEGASTLLILDNLETVWEPVQSQKEVEEFLSLLTDIASLALVTQDHDPRGRKTLQSAMDTAILAASRALSTRGCTQVSLLAHAMDVEGTTAILSRWQREHTSVISEGYDQRSNLALSISLSLASPRITSTPHAQDLLSLLSILPDGLSDVELKQSNFAILDILECKRALLRTALAYTDDHKRLKALVPIREYMAKSLPPTDKITRPLFKHFMELLEVYVAVHGTQSSALYVERLTSNYTNIPSILQNRLYPGHPDLADRISCAANLIVFNASAGKGAIPLMEKVLALLPHSEDQQAKASFTVRLFGVQASRSVPHPETLIAQTFDWLKTFGDPDLEALKYSEMGLSLAQSHGNIGRQSQALALLSWIKRSSGDYITARAYAQEAQRLAKMSGDFHREAVGLYTEVLCCQALGDYRQCILQVIRARALLELGGLSQGDMAVALVTCQVAVHACKSEYADAHDLQQQLLQIYQGKQLYYEGFSLINIAEDEVCMGISYNVIQEKICTSQTIFNQLGDTRLLTVCDMIQADLNLREGDMSCSLFCKCLQFGWGQFSDIVSYCLERLADVTRWGAHHDPSWSIILLAHSVRSKGELAIHKALQFIGDVHLVENDEVMLRTESMIRLGDIAKKNRDLLKALELWETARPLFERSSQAKRLQDIDERISGIGEEVKERHRKNLARKLRFEESTYPEACTVVTVKFSETQEGVKDHQNPNVLPEHRIGGVERGLKIWAYGS